MNAYEPHDFRADLSALTAISQGSGNQAERAAPAREIMRLANEPVCWTPPIRAFVSFDVRLHSFHSCITLAPDAAEKSGGRS